MNKNTKKAVYSSNPSTFWHNQYVLPWILTWGGSISMGWKHKVISFYNSDSVDFDHAVGMENAGDIAKKKN